MNRLITAYTTFLTSPNINQLLDENIFENIKIKDILSNFTNDLINLTTKQYLVYQEFNLYFKFDIEILKVFILQNLTIHHKFFMFDNTRFLIFNNDINNLDYYTFDHKIKLIESKFFQKEFLINLYRLYPFGRNFLPPKENIVEIFEKIYKYFYPYISKYFKNFKIIFTKRYGKEYNFYVLFNKSDIRRYHGLSLKKCTKRLEEKLKKNLTFTTYNIFTFTQIFISYKEILFEYKNENLIPISFIIKDNIIKKIKGKNIEIKFDHKSLIK